MCASHKVRTLFFLAAFLSLPVLPAYPQSPIRDPFEEILEKLRSIENRIGQVEKNQREILAREDGIREELNRIRIWIRRQ